MALALRIDVSSWQHNQSGKNTALALGLLRTPGTDRTALKNQDGDSPPKMALMAAALHGQSLRAAVDVFLFVYFCSGDSGRVLTAVFFQAALPIS